MNTQKLLLTGVVCLAALAAPPAHARIKLVALPDRGPTTIRLDNPAGTLIEEERVLTLQEGLNKVDFSWNGVSLDVDSIRLSLLTHPGKVSVLNVSYPPNEAALVWELSSAGAWEERARISYVLHHVDRLVTYRVLADRAEAHADLQSHLVLRNFSGEDFALARVVLGEGESVDRGILHEETRQLLFLQAPAVPLVKTWTFDAALLPWDPEQAGRNVGIPVHYKIRNADGALGESALWGGKVRVYQEDGAGGTIVLGEDNLELVPVGEDAEIYIGDSRDVVVTQRRMQDSRINVRRNNNSQVVLYDTDEVVTATIENFKDQPATLTMLQHIPGQWEMADCTHAYTRKDADTLEFSLAVPPRGRETLTMHYHRRNVR